MPDQPVNRVLHQLQRLAGAEECSDRELLERFVQHRDGTAYAALVERHGAMVFAVCRRILAHTQDAEDAAQATFLVLARRAGLVRASVAGWLHAVAGRVARKLRARLTRHPVHDLAGIEVPQPDTTAAAAWRELRPLLDAELSRLPEKYRAPLVLCYLEGLTQDEAARRLGWGRDVLRGRLDRGRAQLRARLLRRGVGLSAALLGATLAESVSAAGTTAPLLSLIQAVSKETAGSTASPGAVSARAATLAEEVIRAMIASRLRTTILLLAALVVLASLTGVLAFRAVAGAPAGEEVKAPPATPKAEGIDHPEPAAVAPGRLSGKPTLIMGKNSLGFTLEKPELRQLGGRAFVVGKEVAKSPYTRSQFPGATVWVPLEDVTEMVEFEELPRPK